MRKSLGWIAAGLGAYVVLETIVRNANINKGTPYEGTGVIGTVGNITDKASGGALSRFGVWISNQIDPKNRQSVDELTGTG